jgi:formate hydrogenlyase transcriptional activator
MEVNTRSLIGTCPGIEAVRQAIAQVAATDATVLILGETGTGKELVARALHGLSLRQGAFVPVSGVALAPGLITSELFGHESGAFTGANQRRIGRFEQAHGGTLFLDEIGELPADVQALLLRVLQERMIERVGGGSVAIDARVIAATHRDLLAETKQGRFRTDLYYRLNVFPIRVPPLRDRRGDIPELTNHFLRMAEAKYRRPRLRVSAATQRMLTAHDWPGNLREMQNVIERATIMSTEEDLIFDPAWLVGSSVSESAKTWAAQEKQRILDALQAAGGRVYGPGGAAHRLGLNPTTLYGKMRKHGLARRGSAWQ